MAIDAAKLIYGLRNAISCKLDFNVSFISSVPHVVFRHMYNKVGPSRNTYIKNTARIDKTAISRPFFAFQLAHRAGTRPSGISTKKATVPHSHLSRLSFCPPLLISILLTRRFLYFTGICLSPCCVHAWAVELHFQRIM